MQQNWLQLYGSLIVAEVIFGVWPVVASRAIKEGFDPFVFVLYRCAGSAAVLTAASWWIEGEAPWRELLQQTRLHKVADASRANKSFPWKQFFLMAALMITNFLGYIIGVAFTSSTQAALMQPLAPVVACLTGLATGTEALNTTKLFGILVSVTGAMFVVYIGQGEAVDHGKRAGRQYQLGTLALMVNVISSALYFVLQKGLLRKHKPIFTTSIGMIIATCYLMVLTFFYAEENKMETWRPWILTPRREAALAYAIILTTAVNFVILAMANKATSPSTITAFSTLQPLITVATGVLWLGVFPHHRTVYGGAAILCGLLLTVKEQVTETMELADKPSVSEDSHLI